MRWFVLVFFGLAFLLNLVEICKSDEVLAKSSARIQRAPRVIATICQAAILWWVWSLS